VLWVMRGGGSFSPPLAAGPTARAGARKPPDKPRDPFWARAGARFSPAEPAPRRGGHGGRASPRAAAGLCALCGLAGNAGGEEPLIEATKVHTGVVPLPVPIRRSAPRYAALAPRGAGGAEIRSAPPWERVARYGRRSEPSCRFAPQPKNDGAQAAHPLPPPPASPLSESQLLPGRSTQCST
jgi:hypothetical protein